MTDKAIRSLMAQLERLRRKARLSQVDTAELVGTSRRSYISWMQKKGPRPEREPDIQFAAFIMELGLKEGQLPIQGHDRRAGTAERRRKVIRDLKHRYPVNPYRAARSRY